MKIDCGCVDVTYRQILSALWFLMILRQFMQSNFRPFPRLMHEHMLVSQWAQCLRFLILVGPYGRLSTL